MILWQPSPLETTARTPPPGPIGSVERIPIGRGFKSRLFVLPASLAGCCFLLTGLYWLLEHKLPAEFPALLLPWIGGVAAGLSLVSAAGIHYARRWIEILDDGFRLIDRRGTCEVRDEQVQAAALFWKSRYFSGDFRGQIRYFSLSLDGVWDIERLSIRTPLKHGQHDPLEPLIDRLTARLHERANAVLADRQPVGGAGWTLQRNVLEVGGSESGAGGGRRVEVEDLAAVDVVDGHVCAWIRRRDTPAVRIPQHAENAWLLERLLSERIAAGETAETHPGGDGLGRVLFERRLPRGWVRLFYTGAALSGSIGVWQLAVVFARDGVDVLRLVVGCVFLFLAGVTGWLGEFYRRAVFRCHEFGVSESGLFQTRCVHDDNLQAVTFSSTRQFIHGTYVGTTFLLIFTPREDCGEEVLTYQRIAPQADEELERLRDRAAQAVAAKMAARLAQGRPVEWTASLRLRPEGVEHRPGGLLGRLRSPIIIPYEAVSHYEMDDATFHLWVHGRSRAVLKEETCEPNFYPGAVLLERIVARRTREREE